MREAKIVKPCPQCKFDLAEFMKTASVNTDMAAVIGSLQRAAKNAAAGNVSVAGAARMVAETPNTHPALLREAVCSPGGATIVGLAELEDAGVRGALARAVGKAAARARELSGE
jgi:pyrroline-5-carboxylate reductase